MPPDQALTTNLKEPRGTCHGPQHRGPWITTPQPVFPGLGRVPEGEGTWQKQNLRLQAPRAPAGEQVWKSKPWNQSSYGNVRQITGGSPARHASPRLSSTAGQDPPGPSPPLPGTPPWLLEAQRESRDLGPERWMRVAPLGPPGSPRLPSGPVGDRTPGVGAVPGRPFFVLGRSSRESCWDGPLRPWGGRPGRGQ